MTTREDLKQYVKNQIIEEAKTGESTTIDNVLKHLSDDDLFYLVN